MPKKQANASEFVLIYDTYNVLPSNCFTKLVTMGIAGSTEESIAEVRAQEELDKIHKQDENLSNPRLALIVKSL